MTLASGLRLGPYEILAPLGAGGMGEVYRAQDTKLDREVAIKVLPESVSRDTDVLARFEREAKAVAALSHPNILGIFDFGTHDGTAYAVWRGDGREIYYLAPDGMLMAAPVTGAAPFQTGTPTPLFKVAMPDSPDPQYDVAPDGKRFLVNQQTTDWPA
jgi:hypothetical protein